MYVLLITFNCVRLGAWGFIGFMLFIMNDSEADLCQWTSARPEVPTHPTAPGFQDHQACGLWV
jgi:hypothetical protein